MTTKFSNQKYADIHFVCGSFNANATEIRVEYQRRFLIKTYNVEVFVLIHRRFYENGIGNRLRDLKSN